MKTTKEIILNEVKANNIIAIDDEVHLGGVNDMVWFGAEELRQEIIEIDQHCDNYYQFWKAVIRIFDICPIGLCNSSEQTDLNRSNTSETPEQSGSEDTKKAKSNLVGGTTFRSRRHIGDAVSGEHKTGEDKKLCIVVKTNSMSSPVQNPTLTDDVSWNKENVQNLKEFDFKYLDKYYIWIKDYQGEITCICKDCQTFVQDLIKEGKLKEVPKNTKSSKHLSISASKRKCTCKKPLKYKYKINKNDKDLCGRCGGEL